MSPNKPNRKSPRAGFHDYSGGDYFITICTLDKKHYFGSIINHEMNLSDIGVYCCSQINENPRHYQYAEVPLYVVMPNHIHAIIHIDDKSTPKAIPECRTALSVIIGGLKRAVTMYARRNNIEFGWQNRYHDHIIRGNNDGNRIAEYILNNVALWDKDCFNTP